MTKNSTEQHTAEQAVSHTSVLNKDVLSKPISAENTFSDGEIQKKFVSPWIRNI